MEQGVDLKSRLDKLASMIKANKANVKTEEDTKNFFILPFLEILGYNPKDPSVFGYEYIADVKGKKDEKVDIVIKDKATQEPIVLIEAKNHSENLSNHIGQLKSYFFAKQTAKFGILTNGIEYRFFSDIDADNVMDEEPFLIINLEQFNDRDVNKLKSFAHNELNIESFIEEARKNLSYKRIYDVITQEMQEPSDELVRVIAQKALKDKNRRVTQSVLQEYQELIKEVFKNVVTDSVRNKIDEMQKSLKSEQEAKEANKEIEEEELKPTAEEIKAFNLIFALLVDGANQMLPDDFAIRKNAQYLNVLYKDNRNKWVCRLFFGTNKKYITIAPDGKRIDIEKIEDIYKYKNELHAALNCRLSK